MPVIIETERLYLRHWHTEDKAPFSILNADPDVMRYLPRLLNRAESDDMVERLSQEIIHTGIGFFAMEIKSTGCFIGFTGIAHVQPGELPCAPTIEIGWRLARQAWGFGYATEAARACLQFGFEQRQLAEIVSFTATNNQRSRLLMERIGMTYDAAADFDHPLLAEGHPLRRSVLYCIKSGDIQSSRPEKITRPIAI